MLFVDGENFTIRAQAVAQERNFSLQKGRFWMPDTFVWLPDWPATSGFGFTGVSATALRRLAIRAHYYTSARGDQPKVAEIKESLWSLGFTPSVFQRLSGDRKAKGVDIALTKDMLSHAFLANYDAAVLIAGDGDYVPLVDEVKRLGKLVYVIFFTDPAAGLSDGLRLAADYFLDLTATFFERWAQTYPGPPSEARP
jgi:hypothetical protein